jgi:hypothetical protein
MPSADNPTEVTWRGTKITTFDHFTKFFSSNATSVRTLQIQWGIEVIKKNLVQQTKSPAYQGWGDGISLGYFRWMTSLKRWTAPHILLTTQNIEIDRI